MANQITVNSGTGNITVTTSRSVIGTVANVASANYANFAGEAFDVAAANVTGLGNIATINLDGNVANALLGDGTWGAVELTTANYANYAGNVINAAQPNITSVGNLSNLTVTGTTTTGNLIVQGNLQIGNLVANTANYANFAGEAYLVNAANVNGTVANATFANDAANANIANVAYSVDVANVSGIGNIATINIDGNASNVLHGDGTFGPEGTTGNANYAAYAGNVVDAAQPNITSVGNLTSLTVTGNLVSNVQLIGNNITFTSNSAPAIKINVADDLSTANARNLTLRAGNITTASASNTIPGPMTLAAGSSLNANANLAWIARGGGIVINSGTANTANGNAQAGSLSVQPGPASTGNGIATGGTLSVFGGTAISNTTGNATSGSINIGFASAYAETGNIVIGVMNIGNLTGTANTVGNVIGGTLNIGSINGNATNGNATLNALTINGANARTITSGSATAGAVNINSGAARSENGNATSGSITIQTSAANANVGSGTATVGSINLQIGTPNGITANVKGNVNIATNGQADAVNIGANVNANIVNATYFYGDGSNITNLPGSNAAGNTTEVQFNNSGAFAASNAFTFDSGANALTVNGPINAVSGSYSGTAGGAIQTNIDNVVNCPDIAFNRYDNNSLTNNYSVYRARGTVSSPTAVQPGDYLFSIYNSAYSNVGFEYAATSTYSTVVNTNDGAGNITISSQYGASVIAGSDFNINYGLLQTYSDMNVGSSGTGNITINGDSNLGNVATANYFIGDGSNLSNINGANVSTVANANLATYANIVVDNAQPNITSVGTLTGLDVSGNSNINIATSGTAVVTTGSVYNLIQVNNTSNNSAATVQQQYTNPVTNQGSYVGASETGVNMSLANLALPFPSSLKGVWRFENNGNLSHIFAGTGNINAKGLTLGTGNIGAGNIVATANITGATIIANANVNASNVNVSGSNIVLNANGDINAIGNINGANFTTLGNVNVGNGNIILNNDGNVNLKNIITSDGTITIAADNDVSATGVINANVNYIYMGGSNGNLATNTGIYAQNTVDQLEIGTWNNTYMYLTDTVPAFNFSVDAGNSNIATIDSNGFTTTERLSYLRTFGSFTSNATQTSNGANTTNYMTFNNTEDANGISIANSTEITVARTGRYNIQFSAQLEKTDSGADVVEIWLVKNGNSVANSATQLTLTGNGARDLAAWDFNVDAANVNDYFELAWASPDTNVQLLAIDSANTISGVAVPSVIVNINPVGA